MYLHLFDVFVQTARQRLQLGQLRKQRQAFFMQCGLEYSRVCCKQLGKRRQRKTVAVEQLNFPKLFQLLPVIMAVSGMLIPMHGVQQADRIIMPEHADGNMPQLLKRADGKHPESSFLS